MKKDNCFDNILKSALNDSSNNIEVSRNIFNEAWSKKAEVVSEGKYFNVKCMKKVAVIAACCTIFILASAFTFSPYVRAVASEALRTIFVIDKSGNDIKIIERSEEEKIKVAGFGNVNLTNSNKAEMEKRLGFKVDFPEKISNYYGDTPSVGISVFDIKYKDKEVLIDKFFKAIDDDKIFEELKDYKMERYIQSKYVNVEGYKFLLTLSKEREKLKETDEKKVNVIKEVNIDNIQCRILENLRPKYEWKSKAGYYGEDMTKKPMSIDKQYYMQWNYDGIDYSVYIGEELNADVVIKFVEDYIKILKQQ